MTSRTLLAIVSVMTLSASSAASAQGRSVPVVRLVARGYAFTAPAQSPQGLVRIRLVNRGTVPHYARVARLDSAKTLADFMAWRRQGGRPPGWFVPVGGPAPVSPGDSAEAAAVVRPGRHIVLCSYPTAGGKSAHIDSGMVRELIVSDSVDSTAAPNDRVADLDASFEVVLGEFGFSPVPAVRAGVQHIRVTNAGNFPHQILLIRLPNGTNDRAEMAWFRDNHQTDRPGVPTGGLLEVRPRETGWFSVSLRPGRYMLLCGFVDGPVRHFDKGMARVFEVG